MNYFFEEADYIGNYLILISKVEDDLALLSQQHQTISDQRDYAIKRHTNLKNNSQQENNELEDLMLHLSDIDDHAGRGEIAERINKRKKAIAKELKKYSAAVILRQEYLMNCLDCRVEECLRLDFMLKSKLRMLRS